LAAPNIAATHVGSDSSLLIDVVTSSSYTLDLATRLEVATAMPFDSHKLKTLESPLVHCLIARRKAANSSNPDALMVNKPKGWR
jgi:hypothetical protein